MVWLWQIQAWQTASEKTSYSLKGHRNDDNRVSGRQGNRVDELLPFHAQGIRAPSIHLFHRFDGVISPMTMAERNSNF
jgi:hypothetical protein